ncbi:aspartate aminotransferase [Haematococcus lacustris]
MPTNNVPAPLHSMLSTAHSRIVTARTSAMQLQQRSAAQGVRKVRGPERVQQIRPANGQRCLPLRASRFDSVDMAPADPILGVSEAFKVCTDSRKLNLGVGAYRTEELQPYVLPVVKKAEQKILASGGNKEYLPIEGLDTFRKATVDLLLGASHPAIKEGRVAVLQALSGTGALRVAAGFISRYMKGATVYISNPTWGNHRNIFGDEAVPWAYYRYYDPETVGLDYAGMTADIEAAPEGSIILLHGCAHNPTGIDPTKEQWMELAALCKRKGHLPFFDVAYQGFATGDLDQDAFAPRLFVDQGLEVVVSQSYSKNLGLYGERVGATNVVCSSPEAAKRVLSQLKRIARPMWSNPPLHGARIAAEVVNDSSLFEEWKGEMAGMAGRIARVRGELQSALESKWGDKDWGFITRQIGMFSFTGLSPAQCEHMTAKHCIFMTKDGRISLAGLNSAKVDYLANAIVDSFKSA